VPPAGRAPGRSPAPGATVAGDQNGTVIPSRRRGGVAGQGQGVQVMQRVRCSSSAALIVAVHPGYCSCRSWATYPVILRGLSLGLSSPRFGGTPDAAVVAQLALNLHVSAFWHLYEQARP
jgi:hypothetical protein